MLTLSHIRKDYGKFTAVEDINLELETLGLNLNHINLKETKMRVFGKGRKERMVYLNHA